MIRQRFKQLFSQPALLSARWQSGRSVTRMAFILGFIGALILITTVFLLREKTHPPFNSVPPYPSEPTLQEKMQAADRMVSRVISSLSLGEDHITFEQFPRKEESLTWNESIVTITLPPEISLHQVEHVAIKTQEALRPEGLQTDTVYDSDTCLHITMAVDGRTTHQLLFHLAAPPILPEARASAEPSCRVALVIDDLGENYSRFTELAALEVPITYAILPFRAQSVKIAEEIHAGNSGEIILHLPLEPWNSGNHTINHGTLRVSMSREELLEQLARNINAVPYLSGVSNHMGSKFTEDSEKMKLLLDVLKEKGLYFLDSRTSRKTVGYSLARTMLLKAAQRDLFLDNTRDQQSIEKQLHKIIPLAKKRGGDLVVIGHPHPHTISALKKYLPLLREQGVTIVPLSKLVH